MPIPTSLKTQLLELHRSGKYSTISAERLSHFYGLCHQYMKDTQIGTSNTGESLEEIEYYQLLELLFYLSIQTNHDIEAKVTLQKLSDKFDLSKSERLCILKSIFIEATQGPKDALEFTEGCKIMFENSVNLAKRELALFSHTISTSTSDVREYVKKLVIFLEIHPLEINVWMELSNMYYGIGEFAKSIYCLQEILLIQPFAYNICARIGELYYVEFMSKAKGLGAGQSKTQLQAQTQAKDLSVKYFCRSLELCGNYARAWYGLYKMTSGPGNDSTHTKLNQLALTNLKKLIQEDENNELMNEDLKARITKLVT